MRAALARRGRRRGRRGRRRPRARRAPPRGDHRGRGAAGRAEGGVRGVAAGKREGGDAERARAHARAPGAGQGADEQPRPRTSGCRSSLRTLPNLPDPTARGRGHRRSARSATPGDRPEPRDHLELAGERIDMERGARLSGSRFAYLRGDLVLLELALVRWALDKLAGARLRARHPARARARAGAVRHRLPARHRAADLPAARRRPVPRRHERGRARVAARRRDPRRGGLPLRYAGFSPCFRREAGAAGATRAGSSACTSSTRSRCSASSRRRTRAAEHERHPRDRGGDPRRARPPVPRREHRGQRSRRLAAKKFDLEAWLPGQGATAS